jgi:Xaa-Pro aminopeptidase
MPGLMVKALRHGDALPSVGRGLQAPPVVKAQKAAGPEGPASQKYGPSVPHPRRLTVLAVLCSVLVSGIAAAGPLQDDLGARRSRVMEKIGPDGLAIFWSAPTRVYSHDVDYEYRQDSNLLYLTGINQEETILVLMPGNETKKEILFIRPFDARREHWDGHSLTPAEATAESGIKTVMTLPEFEPFIAAMFSRRATPPDSGEHARFFEAVAASRARLGLLLERQTGLSAPVGPVTAFAAKLRERFFGFVVQDVTPIVHEFRQVKTAYEHDVLRKSVSISSDAHRAGMKAASPGKFEYEVEAAIEEVYLRNGAMSWGYPSIVGSGPNATILHYQKSSRQMQAGDLLLVDAAGSYQGYTGDITRTYPISGRFSREQRDVYEIVFAAQEAGMRAARAGSPASAVQNACDEVLRAGLLKLGLITEPTGMQFKIWSTHGVLHYIGMDVHDVSTRRQLDVGMAFVIEPGIYIRPAALDNLPKTPENAAFIAKVRPAVDKYRDIGVRIEDSFLLTASGLERMSERVPRTIDEIERFMSQTGSK